MGGRAVDEDGSFGEQLEQRLGKERGEEKRDRRARMVAGDRDTEEREERGIETAQTPILLQRRLKDQQAERNDERSEENRRNHSPSTATLAGDAKDEESRDVPAEVLAAPVRPMTGNQPMDLAGRDGGAIILQHRDAAWAEQRDDQRYEG